METITSIPPTRLKIADCPPEVLPENPPERFAQVMARQEKFTPPRKNPVGSDRERPPRKIVLPLGRNPNKRARTRQIIRKSAPSLRSRFSNGRLLHFPSFDPRTRRRTSKARLFPQNSRPYLPSAFAATEQINAGSRIQPGPGEIPVKTSVPLVEPQHSILPGTLRRNKRA